MNELILGLLMINNMTTYEIKKAIQNGMNLISSDSMGNIHASIKKLLQSNYITFKESVDNGKFKKVYSISMEGREYFESWINSPFESSHKRNPELKKIFFMAFSSKEARKSRIQEYIELIKVEKIKLQQLQKYSSTVLNEIPETQQEIGFFQLETIQYGLDLMSFEISWYENFLRKLT